MLRQISYGLPLSAFTEIELEVIRNIARYHRKSKPKKKHQAYSNLPSKHQEMVQQLSAILPLAVALDRRQSSKYFQI